MPKIRAVKDIARALHDALKAKGIETTDSESLELIEAALRFEGLNGSCGTIEPGGTPASEARSPPSPRTQNDPARPKAGCCSFCGKSQQEVRKLIAGPEAAICDECIDLCTGILDNEGR
jgi:hypothetical protein